MKKIFTVIIISAVIFVSACGGVSMKELLTVEEGSYTAELSTTLDDETLMISVIKDGGTLSFVVDEKYTFVYNGGNWSVSYSGLTVPISADSIKRSVPQKLCTALTATPDAGWKISEEVLDGVYYHKCECQTLGVTLFIDAKTNLPLKIISGGMEFSVLKFEPASA